MALTNFQRNEKSMYLGFHQRTLCQIPIQRDNAKEGVDDKDARKTINVCKSLKMASTRNRLITQEMAAIQASISNVLRNRYEREMNEEPAKVIRNETNKVLYSLRSQRPSSSKRKH